MTHELASASAPAPTAPEGPGPASSSTEGRGGGATPSSTRCTCAPSPTATATASAICAGPPERLPYLAELGVDAVWLTPFYASPQADGGYDVADYRAVDPLFGDLADADDLVRTAHELGLRVIVDIVPNHTSDQHPWFRAALADQPGVRPASATTSGPARAPPASCRRTTGSRSFGGPAWTRTPDG